MKNDLIFMTTTTEATVLANGIVPLTNIARRRGCALQGSNNAITFMKPGYYKVSGTITFTAPTIGDATIVVSKNGTPVSGIEATSTVSTATTQVQTLPLDGIVRVYCNEGTPTLTLVNTGIGITISNVALDVEYLG